MRSYRFLTRSTRSIALIFLMIAIGYCGGKFRPITGFTQKANQQLETFIMASDTVQGRKIAVFDGDGTVLGQAPHYLADECMYLYAKDHPQLKPDLIEEMKGQSNVSLPYVQNRVHFMEGKSLQFLRDLGEACFNKYYSNKIFEPMRDLIGLLQENNFEVWIVTASPEAMYQQFLSKAFHMPITHIIGVKSVISDGLITSEIVQPVPQDRGKMEAIETFVQDVPLLVAGNSRGDKEMIEYSKGLKLIVNPDEHIAPDQTESIADYAKKNNWLVVRIKDVPEPGFPWVSSRDYGIRVNKSHDVK